MNLTIFVPEQYRKQVESSKKKLNLSKLFLSAFKRWKGGEGFEEATRETEKMRTALRKIGKIARSAQNGKEEKEEE